jgi:carbonic anhydrase
MSNKLLLYKVMLKPIWTYAIQLLGSAPTSNIEILERFQSKALRIIADAQWYVPNVIHRQELQIPLVKEEIRYFSIKYSFRLQTHPNSLAVHLTEPPEHR